MVETRKKGALARPARMAVAAGLALTIALGGAAASAFAAEPAPTGYSITVNKATEGTYQVYQISTGKFAESDGKLVMNDITVNPAIKDTVVRVLTDVGYAPDLSGTERQQAFSISDKFVEAEAAGKAQAVANKLALALSTAKAAPAAEVAAAGGKVSVPNLAQGYYLVMSKVDDGTFSQDGNAMTSAMLVKVNGDVAADAKVSKPTLDKQVKEGAAGHWDSAYGHAADSGLAAGKLGAVSYKLTGTVASNIADYDQYIYSIEDTLPAGLAVDNATFNTKWSMSIHATSDSVTKPVDITASFRSSASTDKKTGVTTLIWEADNLKAELENAGITGADLKTAKVTVEYTPVYDQAALDAFYAKASTLAKPQVNVANIRFSNNPYEGGHGGTSTTPDHEAKLYSYNLVVNKVDQATKALPGAAFTLTDGNGVTLGRDITAADDGTFTFTGLQADVEYTLTETQVPTGKRAIEPIKFTITANRDQAGDNVTGLTAKEGADPSGAATLTVDDATVKATVVNVDGPNLPVTGQAGIAAGVVIGGAVLTVSAVAIARQRREGEDA